MPLMRSTAPSLHSADGPLSTTRIIAPGAPVKRLRPDTRLLTCRPEPHQEVGLFMRSRGTATSSSQGAASMSPTRTVTLTDELYEQASQEAQAEGKTTDEITRMP